MSDGPRKKHDSDTSYVRRVAGSGKAVSTDVVRMDGSSVRPVVDAASEDSRRRRSSRPPAGRDHSYVPPPPSSLPPGSGAKALRHRARQLPPPVAVIESDAPPARRSNPPRPRSRPTSGADLPTLVENPVPRTRRPPVRPRDRRIDEGRPVLAERVRVSGVDALQSRSEPTSSLAVATPNERILAIVRELLACEPGEAGHVIQRLMLFDFRVVLPMLVARFPGVLWFDRKRPHRRLPQGRDISAIAAALVAWGDRAVPHTIDLLKSPSADVRYYAALVAEDLGDPSTIPVLSDLLLDDKIALRDIGAFALGAFKGQTPYEEALTTLRRQIADAGAEPPRARYAIEALIRLRDTGAVPDFIDGLDSAERDVARLCRAALQTLTARDFGGTPADWQAWLRKHREETRYRWLLDGLIDRKPGVRELAYRELSHLTGQDFGSPPSARRGWKELRMRFEAWLTDPEADPSCG